LAERNGMLYGPNQNHNVTQDGAKELKNISLFQGKISALLFIHQIYQVPKNRVSFQSH
jgi:hypothetical protein